jgi:hypothetical protein
MATWDSVDVRGWLVWDMWVVRMAASAVVRSWPPAAWDGPSAGSSFVGLSWMAFRGCFVGLTTTVGVNVGICLPRASKSRTREGKNDGSKLKIVGTGHMSERAKNKECFNRLG